MAAINNVTRMLAARGIEFKTHELPDAKLGAQEAADYLGIAPHLVYKSIIAVRGDSGAPVLALVSGTQRVDLKALGRSLGTKKLKTASLAQAESITDLQVGGISPLALLSKGIEIVIDESVRELEMVYISGGMRGMNISMSPQDLIEITQAKIAQISANA